MTIRFDYKLEDVNTIAAHLNTLSRQAAWKVVERYKDVKGMSEKIACAVKVAKMVKLQAEMDALQ